MYRSTTWNSAPWLLRTSFSPPGYGPVIIGTISHPRFSVVVILFFFLPWHRTSAYFFGFASVFRSSSMLFCIFILTAILDRISSAAIVGSNSSVGSVAGSLGTTVDRETKWVELCRTSQRCPEYSRLEMSVEEKATGSKWCFSLFAGSRRGRCLSD
jgi:hypothetical protein